MAPLLEAATTFTWQRFRKYWASGMVVEAITSKTLIIAPSKIAYGWNTFNEIVSKIHDAMKNSESGELNVLSFMQKTSISSLTSIPSATISKANEIVK